MTRILGIAASAAGAPDRISEDWTHSAGTDREGGLYVREFGGDRGTACGVDVLVRYTAELELLFDFCVGDAGAVYCMSECLEEKEWKEGAYQQYAYSSLRTWVSRWKLFGCWIRLHA